MIIELQLDKKSLNKLKKEYQKWCEGNDLPFPNPEFGCVADVKVGTGYIKARFINDKAWDVLSKAVGKSCKLQDKYESKVVES